MQLFRNTNIDFVGRAKTAFILSLIVILAGAISLAVKGGPRWSIDFTGGTMLQVQITPTPDIGRIRAIMAEAGFAEAQVQDFGDEDEFLLTLPAVAEGGVGAAERMRQALVEKLGGATVEMRREETVGPKIGGELKTSAANSVLAACLLIVLYITVRFVFRYSIAAILATLHDVIITLGVFSLLNKEISLSIIAAFLTIIGYSLNDTIVVFDRIRENMRQRRKESYREVCNRSINDTLSRTILTAGTTLLASLALYFLGGPVIRDFAFCLSFGVLIGTFSSIFIASPILIWWTERRVTSKRGAVQPAM